MRARDVYGCVLLGILAAVGCTFANSFGEVKTTVAGGDSGNPNDSGGGDVITSEDGAPPPKLGLIVMGGVVKVEAGPPQQVLEVIDPATGKELSREFMTVSAILYDGARDWWYIFKNTGAGGFQPLPNDPVKMEVRRWIDGTGWSTADTKAYDVPTPIGQDTTVMTEQEPVYIAYKPGSTVTSFTYVIAPLDAKDIHDISLVASDVKDYPGAPLAAMGSRAGGGKSGGNFNVLERSPCDEAGTICDLAIDHWIIPDSFGPPTHDTLYKIVGSTPLTSTASPGYGSRIGSSPEDLLALVLPADTQATLYRVSSGSPSTVNTVPFGFTGTNRQLKPIAVDECDDVAFVPELVSENIYIVPMPPSKVKAATQGVGHPAQRVVWEPFTRTMLAPFNQGGGFEISAYTVELQGDNSFNFKKRVADTWDPPKEFGPQITVTKVPSDNSYCSP